MSADEAVERLRGVLAECGRPDIKVSRSRGRLCHATPLDESGRAAAWLAYDLAFNGQGEPGSGLLHACWPCWEDGPLVSFECEQGNCHHPDEPRRPPAELLRRRVA